jgi:hypothetical protein
MLMALICELQLQLRPQYNGFWGLHNGVATAILTALAKLHCNIKVQRNCDDNLKPWLFYKYLIKLFAQIESKTFVKFIFCLNWFHFVCYDDG